MLGDLGGGKKAVIMFFPIGKRNGFWVFRWWGGGGGCLGVLGFAALVGSPRFFLSPGSPENPPPKPQRKSKQLKQTPPNYINLFIRFKLVH